MPPITISKKLFNFFENKSNTIFNIDLTASSYLILKLMGCHIYKFIVAQSSKFKSMLSNMFVILLHILLLMWVLRIHPIQ